MSDIWPVENNCELAGVYRGDELGVYYSPDWLFSGCYSDWIGKEAGEEGMERAGSLNSLDPKLLDCHL